METIVTIISGLVIICLLGTMLYATKAIKAQRAKNMEERQRNLTRAGIFFVGYLLLNVIRLLAVNNFQ